MKIVIVAALTCLQAWLAPALAQEITAAEAPAALSPFGAVASIEDRQLGTITGQADVHQVVEARNTSEVSHNIVSGNSVTGTITFDGNSFADLHGLSVLSANTGNNVAINASLNVNVAIHP